MSGTERQRRQCQIRHRLLGRGDGRVSLEEFPDFLPNLTQETTSEGHAKNDFVGKIDFARQCHYNDCFESNIGLLSC